MGINCLPPPPPLACLLGQLRRHDAATEAHCWHTLYFAQLGVNLDGVRPRELYYAALMHDIGKMHVSILVLRGKNKIDVRGRQDILDHPGRGAEILINAGYPELAPLLRAHHERWDGQGYPDGMKGTDIPLEARIISIADSFAAMLEPRSYRSTLSHCSALSELEAGAGKQFDPAILKIILSRLKRCSLRFKDGMLIENSFGK